MTEKHYGGASSFGAKDKKPNVNTKETVISEKKKNKNEKHDSEEMNMSSYIKAGKILVQTKEYAKNFIKKDMPLLEIADKIEAKIVELGGKPAFPVNLSINEVAAHSTPSFNDTEKASGLLKIDLGVQIEGYTADSAFSLDLENNEENKRLIEAAEEALKEAVSIIKMRIKIRKIGETIEKTIKKYNLIPIQNLSGHSIERYDLHSGITIPNVDNYQEAELEEGVYAVEPFSTSGLGAVRDGRMSGIYNLEREGNVRDNFARSVLQFIAEEYQTLPFCSRWIHKKFGSRGILALRQIEQAGLLHQYPQLIEKGKGKVAQAEHTLIVKENEVIVITKSDI